jgi:hypothetical protein
VFAQAPHVFQINYETSPVADAALNRIAQFIRRLLGQPPTD